MLDVNYSICLLLSGVRGQWSNFVLFQKRKTLRAAILPSQRRAKSNGVKEAGSISLAVERGARRRDEPRVPRYLPAYTPDVSHLVV